MAQFCKIDPETGLFIEDAIFDSAPMQDTWPTDEDGEPIPPDEPDPEHPRYIPDPAYVATPVLPDAGFQWPRWDAAAGVWVEGGTPVIPVPVTLEPTLEERNRADIDYLAMMLEVEL